MRTSESCPQKETITAYAVACAVASAVANAAAKPALITTARRRQARPHRHCPHRRVTTHLP